MAVKNYTGIIPQQLTGKEIVAEAATTFKDIKDANLFYVVAKERLLNCNNWHKIAVGLSARFQLVNENGDEVNRPAQKGDYLKIDIPGPGSKAGEGYDWVVIEDLKEIAENNVQSTGFRVKPTVSPIGNSKDVAHFYAASSTSSFIITREGKKITATIVDRNLQPNKDPESVADKIRDTAIGLSALTTFSKIQWQNLAEGLIKQQAA